MSQTRTSIVCGVDGSVGGAEAARVGDKVCGVLHGRLILVPAVDRGRRRPEPRSRAAGPGP